MQFSFCRIINGLFLIGAPHGKRFLVSCGSCGARTQCVPHYCSMFRMLCFSHSFNCMLNKREQISITSTICFSAAHSFVALSLSWARETRLRLFATFYQRLTPNQTKIDTHGPIPNFNPHSFVQCALSARISCSVLCMHTIDVYMCEWPSVWQCIEEKFVLDSHWMNVYSVARAVTGVCVCAFYMHEFSIQAHVTCVTFRQTEK